MRRSLGPGLALLALTLTLAAGGGCETFRGLIEAEKPSARVTGARLEEIGLAAATIVFDVEVKNPLGAALSVGGIDFRLASRGKRFLEGKASAEGPVPAGGARTVAVPARVSFPELLATLGTVRAGAVVPYAAEIGLSVDAPGLGPLRLPVAKEGELPVPAAPDISLVALRWEELSFDAASAALALRIENRNEFAVDLTRLSYKLALAGAEIAKGGAGEKRTLEPGEAQTLEIGARFAPKDLGFALFRALTGERASYTLEGGVALGTRFGAIELPYERKGEVPFSR